MIPSLVAVSKMLILIVLKRRDLTYHYWPGKVCCDVFCAMVSCGGIRNWSIY